VVVWLAIGAVVFFYMNSRSPGAIQETAATFIEG
jgi:hypothetical protein